MVAIPGGKFLMGSPPEEVGRSDDEGPQHEVTVEPFFIGRYPVTQEQWRIVASLPMVERELNPDPSRFKGEPRTRRATKSSGGEASRRPVENITWYEAVEFCARLSRLTGRPYRLPTEAEWEYACRSVISRGNPPVVAPNSEESIPNGSPRPAGEGQGERAYPPFHFGETITPELANYDGKYTYADGPKGEYRGETTPVDHFGIANNFGLCDLHGNVYEWCQDHWHENYEGAPDDGSAWLTEDENARRVRRGGCWVNNPAQCRSACRFYFFPDDRHSSLGLRVACAAPRT